MAKAKTSVSVTTEAGNLIDANFDHLVAVIDATSALQDTASNACILELRLMVSMIGGDGEFFSTLMQDVQKWETWLKKYADWKVERMLAFSKHISGRAMAMHAAALDFREDSKGRFICDCQAFRIQDESTVNEVRYTATLSGMYNQLWTALKAVLIEDAEAAIIALHSDTASADIRRLYDALLEARDTAASKGKGKENASGEDETEALPEDAPDWLKEAFNAAESVKRKARAAWITDAEVASKVIPPVTASLQDLARHIDNSIRAAVTAETE